MKDKVEIEHRSCSDDFFDWVSGEVMSRIPEHVHSPGSVVSVIIEAPEEYGGKDIEPNDLLQVDVKIRQAVGGKEYRQLWKLYRALRPKEMLEQAETFLQHAIDMSPRVQFGLDHIKLSTFDGGLNGGIELNAGGTEQVLTVSACLYLGEYPCKNGLAYTVENEGGNAEPAVPTFLGALCQALEIFYSWQLYDAVQLYERKESE